MSSWLAPAKLNLFLHITGRNSAGYHLLQTVFQFIDYYDELEFETRPDDQVRQARTLEKISEDEDLAVRAARELQAATGCKKGVNISIKKNIPTGSGLGGGSSDAATTLIALNKIWNLGLDRRNLAEIGLKIGADVPVFVHGFNAWAEGIGEQLTPIELKTSCFVVVIPPIHVSTAEIFSNLKLTPAPKPIKIRDFLAGRGVNHLQSVTCELYPQVQLVINWLSGYGKAQMSGSGAAVFMETNTQQQAMDIVKSTPEDWKAFFARGLTKHPHG